MPRRPPLVRLASAGALLSAGLAASVGAAAPAAADQSAATSATVTLEGGGLSISAPVSAGNLGTRSTGVGAVTISGQLGQVQVTDSRNAPRGSGWTAQAISTAFEARTGTASIGAGSVGYTAGPITRTGIATYTADNPTGLSGATAVVTATDITGDNTATWNPTIHVVFPANMPADEYVGSIVHSVS